MGKRSFLDVVRQRNADPGQSTRAVTAAKAAALALTATAIATGAYVAWSSVTPAPAPPASVAAPAPAPKAASPVTLLETLRDVTTTDESKRQAATGHVGLTGALLVSPAFVSVLLPDSIVPVLCEVPKCAWYVDAHVAVELVPLLVSAVESGTNGSGLALRRIARWLDTAPSLFEGLGDRVYAAKYAALDRILAISGTEAGVAIGGFGTETRFKIEKVIEALQTTRTPSAAAFLSRVNVEFPELVQDSLLDAAIDLAAAGLYRPVSSLVLQSNGMKRSVRARIESRVQDTDYAGRTTELQGILRLYHLIAPVRSLDDSPFRDAVERLENSLLTTVDDMYCALISVSRVRTTDGSYDTSRARRVFEAAQQALPCNQAFDLWYGFLQFRQAAATSYLKRFVTENIRNLPSLIEKWDGEPIGTFLGDSIASLSNGNGPRASDFASGLCACETWSREICTLVAHMAINPERVTSDLVRVVAHMAGQEGVTDSQLENVAGPPGGKTKLSDFLCETWDVTADVVTVAIMIGLFRENREVALRIAESVAIKGFAKHASTILKGYTGLPKRFQARADEYKAEGYTITDATPLCLLGPALRARGAHGPAISKTLTEAETQLLVRRWYRSESGLHDPTAPLVLATQSLSDPTRVLIADVVARARARYVPWASELDALIASPGPGKIGFGMLYTE